MARSDFRSARGAGRSADAPRGARRMADIEPAFLAELNAGRAASRTLVESLAIDFRLLFAAAAGPLDAPAARELDPTNSYVARCVAAGRLLHQRLGPGALAVLGRHPSDTVRGWLAFGIAADPALDLAARLAKIRPLADDAHAGVRECAWLALRPAIAADVPAALATLRSWTADASANVRRFASEATRPRGVWCAHLPALKRDPAPAEPILEPLRADPSRYVQNSVANWINDASKTAPAWAKAICARWTRESASPHTAYIARRGLRTLAKQG